MPTERHVRDFEDQGYLVVPDVVPADLRARIEAKYQALLDGLFAQWVAEGRLPAPEGLDFWDKLRAAYVSGGIVLLHPLTPHASLPNGTDPVRWDFDLRYNITGQPTERAHFPDFVARSLANPETELTNWQDWRQMWRDARARLATEPHIPIHRWQSNAPFCA